MMSVKTNRTRIRVKIDARARRSDVSGFNDAGTESAAMTAGGPSSQQLDSARLTRRYARRLRHCRERTRDRVEDFRNALSRELDAGVGDERDQSDEQRVLKKILTFVATNERAEPVYEFHMSLRARLGRALRVDEKA
jgi:hypothetical protein